MLYTPLRKRRRDRGNDGRIKFVIVEKGPESVID